MLYKRKKIFQRMENSYIVKIGKENTVVVVIKMSCFKCYFRIMEKLPVNWLWILNIQYDLIFAIYICHESKDRYLTVYIKKANFDVSSLTDSDTNVVNG